MANAAQSIAGALGFSSTGIGALDETLELTTPGITNSLSDEIGLVSPSVADNIWSFSGEDWYKSFGFRFTVISTPPPPATPEEGPAVGSIPWIIAQAAAAVNNAASALGFADPDPKHFHFTLPIPPQSFIVKPVIPARITPTFGGMVEEVSPIKIWIISMQGTTGTAVGRGILDGVQRRKMATEFRDVIKTTGLLAGAEGAIQSAISGSLGVADTLADAAAASLSAIEDGDPLAAASAITNGVTGALNNAIMPPLPYNSSAVQASSNGFTEAQEMMKFFYFYQELKGKNPKKYSLEFSHFKTDMRWRVIIKDFTLQQNAQNPFLYKYNIQLHGWDVLSSGKDRDDQEYDRFSVNGDLAQMNPFTIGSQDEAWDAISGAADNTIASGWIND